MEDNSLPPTGPQEESHKQAADYDSAQESKTDGENISPFFKTRGRDAWTAALAFFFADSLLCFLFGGLSDFFESHNAPVLAVACFCLFLVTIVAGITGVVWKAWPAPKPTRLICWVGFFMWSALAAIVLIYSGRSLRNTPAMGVTAAKPHLSAGLRFSDWHLDIWLTNDFLKVPYVLTKNKKVSLALSPGAGFVNVPVEPGQTNFSLAVVITNDSTNNDPTFTIEDVKIVLILPSDILFYYPEYWQPLLPEHPPVTASRGFIGIINDSLLPADPEELPAITIDPTTCAGRFMCIYLILRSKNTDPEVIGFWLRLSTTCPFPFVASTPPVI
jgi:hypothetical protein